MSFFDIQNTAFTILNYHVSYIELLGTVFGLISVYYASAVNVLTWPTGILNELFFFILFFQVRLYADMFLQVYFFVITIYGWYNWNSGKTDLSISGLDLKAMLILLLLMAMGSVGVGVLIKNIHHLLPRYFSVPAAFPFIDSAVMVASIFATVLLSRKKIETWYLWIAVDVVCVGLYFKKQIYFFSIEYFIFLLLASYGLYHWRKELKND
ncbi:nicotinamide riboside transporter PnuC [Mucilaginibacter celer]|uniref:Nicotinamide riboside transporter PnuC n=1 Tax=Mucilaginibacter celer TaxID=2305508 RepID=A0A494VKT6_9SPHI|nr:nicotinamide riboside transporter PnuC [Mucilaginibacter celer]AYL95816.1 nicotinamide riboside transporter PnuC [Mucilaginibacter celer]